MRACEGCRRRKIKCDAATTNSWPCAACVRLKLGCIPPTVNYNRPPMGMHQSTGLERVLDFATDSGDSSGDESYMPNPMMRNMYDSPELMPVQPSYGPPLLSLHTSLHGSIHGSVHGSVHGSPYQEKADLLPMRFDGITSAPVATTGISYPPRPAMHAHMPSAHTIHIVDSSADSWPHNEPLPGSQMTDVLGDLKIDTNAIGKSFETL